MHVHVDMLAILVMHEIVMHVHVDMLAILVMHEIVMHVDAILVVVVTVAMMAADANTPRAHSDRSSYQ